MAEILPMWRKTKQSIHQPLLKPRQSHLQSLIVVPSIPLSVPKGFAAAEKVAFHVQ